ncbi:MAG: hypothetical protein IKL81_00240 [Clostridia bacterium]|nr:hypothetical protein [Clostridia bacterium]
MKKTVTVISIIVNLAIVIFAVLQVANVLDRAVDICVPLMGVSMLCQAYVQWNTSRKVAYFSIGTAVFVFICSVVVFFIK